MSEMTLGQVWRSLTVAQAWAISASIVAVLSGAFALGVLVQSSRDNATINGKEREISRLNAEFDSVKLANQGAAAEFRQQVADAKRTTEALEKGLAAALGDRGAFEGKAEFLHRYVEYVQTRNEVSKKLLVDVVCKLWRDTQKRRISFESRSLEVSSSIAKQVDGSIRVVKVITFFDGMRYQMPNEIAVSVHTHPECSPL